MAGFRLCRNVRKALLTEGKKNSLGVANNLVLQKARTADVTETQLENGTEARMENGTEAREANGLKAEKPVTDRQCLQENRQDTYGLCLKTR